MTDYEPEEVLVPPELSGIEQEAAKRLIEQYPDEFQEILAELSGEAAASNQ
jgi:hypothetical protein